MGFFDWLFGKKKKDGLGEDDGQAQYFKEDFGSKPAKSIDKELINNKEEKSNESAVKQVKTKKEEQIGKSGAKEKVEQPFEITKESPEVKSANTVKEGRATLSGKFDIQKAKDGRFFFSLYASNGLVIAYSQMYSSIGAANNGIKSIINNMDKAGVEDTTIKKSIALPCPKWEIYIDKAGEYRFRLYATNGQCVCHSSHGYATKSGCKGGIDSIKRFAAEAKIDKSYLK